jgi:hypothetical protein
MRYFTKYTTARVAAIGFFMFLLFVNSADASDASLSDIEICSTQNHLLLYFKVENCFTEDMKAAIDSGIMTTFNFHIRVYEVRPFLWDKKITTIKVNHHIQYDSLKRVYEVRLLEKDDKPIFIKDFDEARSRMSDICGLKIADLQEIQTGTHYQVRMMVELDKIRLPFYLHNVFVFLSLWDFQTDWYTLDFTF